MKKLLTLILTLAWCVPAFAVKTNDLPTAAAVSGSTKIIVTVGGTTYNATADQLLALLSGTGYAVAWSNVTGEPLSITALENAGTPTANTIPLFSSGSTGSYLSMPLFSQTFVSSGSSATAMKTTLSLQNVDNTSDANKPVSSAAQTALNGKLDASAASALALSGSWSDVQGKPSPTLTIAGDATGSVTLTDVGSGTLTLTHESTGVASGNYGSTSVIPTIGVDGKGRIISVTSSTVTPGAIGLGNVDNTSDANKPVSTPQQAALDLKVDLSEVSTTGGISKILRTGTDGNLLIGPLVNDGDLNTWPKLIIPNRKQLIFSGTNGEELAGVYMDQAHSGGAELIFGSPRYAFYWTSEIQMGPASPGRTGKRSIYLRSPTATITDTLCESPAIEFRTHTWTGSANTPNNFTVQGVPLATTGSDAVIRVTANATTSGTGTVSGDMILDIANAGINMGSGKTVTISGTGRFLASASDSLAAPAYGATGSPGAGMRIVSGVPTLVSGSAAIVEVRESSMRSYLPNDIRWGGQGGIEGGADSNASTLTATTNKIFSVRVRRYDSASAVWTGLHFVSNNGNSVVNLGGGTSVNAPSTQTSIWSGTSQTVTGNGIETLRSTSSGIAIGGSTGSAISSAIVASASVDFGSVGPTAEDQQSISVTGALPSSEVALKVSGTLEPGLVIKQVSTGSDAAIIRVLNTGTGTVDPAPITIRALVFSH